MDIRNDKTHIKHQKFTLSQTFSTVRIVRGVRDRYRYLPRLYVEQAENLITFGSSLLTLL